MKPIRIALCFILLGLLAVPASGFALTVGNPSKNGSLLVFPLVDVTGGNDAVIAITNTFYATVNLACYYHSHSGDVAGAIFAIDATKTAWFSLKTGVGSMQSPLYITGMGDMKCWAVNEAGSQQISWNYLQGFAEIANSAGTWGYTSWNFAANKARGEPVGEPGVIKLSGLPDEYDAMPKMLQFTVPGTVSQATLTLVLGKEDVTQDREKIYSKATFRYAAWGSTGTKCIDHQVQTGISSAMLGSFRVQGIASTVCDTEFKIPKKTTQNSPLLGVLQGRSKISGSSYGIMPSGSGADGSGYILWEPDFEVPEKDKR